MDATFLVRLRMCHSNMQTWSFGGMTVVAGTVATLLGGWLGDRLLRRTPAAYQLVSAVGMALSIPAIVLAIYHPERPCIRRFFWASSSCC